MTDKAVLQKLFDTSLGHIQKQRFPSLSDRLGVCAYRGSGGRSCAAAPFILEYDRAMEHNSWDQLRDHFRDHLDPRAVEHTAFVCSLQEAHDNAADDCDTASSDSYSETMSREFMKFYEQRMKEIAEKHSLVYQEPSE